MKKNSLLAILLCFLACWFTQSLALAGSPVFTLTPLTPTSIQISPVTTATVQYIVQNQSIKSHSLVISPITGINQITSSGNCPNPFVLNTKQSCLLTLEINGSQITKPISGGPVVCQQKPDGSPNPLLCYQPSASNVLNITLAPQYVITPSAGANGTISPNTPQSIYSGQSITFTATPNPYYAVSQWLVDGELAQTGGSTFTLTNVTAKHTVQVTFIKIFFFSGTQNGNVYISLNGGLTWTATTVPGGGSAINCLFATNNILYAGTANGSLFYSTNNGTSWNSTSQPDGSGVNAVFVNANMIYVGTANGNVFYSSDNGSNWTVATSPDGSAVNGIFVTANAIYAGTANGNVYYSLNNGVNWTAINGQPDGSSISSVFVNNNTLYVGTSNEYVYSSTALTGGGSWTTLAQSVYSLFVNANDNTLYAGTQSGYVYSVTGGTELGFVTFSPITSVFVLN